MSAVEKHLEQLQPCDHVVQFYESDEHALISNVARYLLGGVKRRESLLVVAATAHRLAFTQSLQSAGLNVNGLVDDGTLLFLDAEDTMARFMVDGYPDAERFETSVGSVVRTMRTRSTSGLRAYGEMVGILWKNRQFPAAIRLEQLWHKLLESIDFTLFCAYPIDVFDVEFQPGVVDALLSAHTHLVPVSARGDLETALERAVLEVLGTKRPLTESPVALLHNIDAALAPAESTILWLRHAMPERAPEILQAARRHYRAITGTA